MEFSWSAPRHHICSSDNLSRQRLMSSSESCIRFTDAAKNISLIWSGIEQIIVGGLRVLQAPLQVDARHVLFPAGSRRRTPAAILAGSLVSCCKHVAE